MLTANQKKAIEYTKRIYRILEQGRVEDALLKFHQYRRPLKKYSQEDEFIRLEYAIYTANDSIKKK